MADVNIKEMVGEINNTFHQLKEQLEKKGDAASIEKIQDRLDELEVKAQRINTAPATENKSQDGPFKVNMEHKAAYDKFCRQGVQSLTPDEIKLMTVQNDTTGGYLASYEYDNNIIKGLIEFSPIRSLCRVTPTSKRGIHVPVRKTVPKAYWTEIGEEPTESQSTYGLEELANHSMTAKIVIHQDDLDDSDFNLENEVITDAIEQFSVLEGQGFLTGDTKKKPEGLLFNSSISDVETASAGSISGDDLINLYYKIKTGYSDRATWIMQRLTIREIRKLKDSQGRYIWTPMGGIEGLSYNSILGRPYMEMPDMPEIATGAYPVMFGDYQRGYRISDRKGIETVRDNLTRAGKREVIFYLHKRVGGMVVLAEAMTRLKVK